MIIIHAPTLLILAAFLSVSSEALWKTVHVLVDDDVMDFPECENEMVRTCGHQSELGQVSDRNSEDEARHHSSTKDGIHAECCSWQYACVMISGSNTTQY